MTGHPTHLPISLLFFAQNNPKFLPKAFFIVSSCFVSHPITVVLKLLGGRMHGPNPTLDFWGTVPTLPLSLCSCALHSALLTCLISNSSLPWAPAGFCPVGANSEGLKG